MKIFSVEEANSLLPAVRDLVRKIQRAHAQIISQESNAKLAAEFAEQGGGGIASGVQYAANLIDMTSLVGELEALGVQLKDFSRGLIDFPSLRDGRVVLLCWQLGEGDRLEWWHDVETGFAGRTPL
ncbi:MAG: uncharacterized protein JWM21_3491 [Acidobacteria bacterium]|nr:uncharacterized protein [Acidobacteriota bacterium]